jgi:hypothetical protein
MCIFTDSCLEKSAHNMRAYTHIMHVAGARGKFSRASAYAYGFLGKFSARVRLNMQIV